MTKHEFIFSDRYRTARHLSFWVTWCIVYNILFHFPIHVFRGWDTNGPWNANLQKLGLPLFFVKTLLVNSFLAVIVPQVFFTYAVIYWLLPRFFYKKENVVVKIVITVLVLAIFFSLATAFKHSPVIYNFLFGPRVELLGFWETIPFVLVDQVTSLPIVAGFVLMVTLIKRWWSKYKEASLLAGEKVNAELRLLKAQIHPHFLFNTLNNIYFFTLSSSSKAPEMISKLSGIMHYIFQECESPVVLLDKEIRMLVDYMALEKIRYGDQMTMIIDVPENCQGKMIAPLLLIPFVENSFKHGASKSISPSYVTLRISIDNNRMNFFIKNNLPPVSNNSSGKGNIGLINVKKRLQLLYPVTHELNINAESESFTVELSMLLNNEDEYHQSGNQLKAHVYAMA